MGMFKKGQEWLGEKCMDCEAEHVRPREKPKKTWTEVMEKDSQVQQLHEEDGV